MVPEVPDAEKFDSPVYNEKCRVTIHGFRKIESQKSAAVKLTALALLVFDLLIRILFYMCELQSLRHAGQETGSKNCACASC
jgi:hypothetical protein